MDNLFKIKHNSETTAGNVFRGKQTGKILLLNLHRCHSLRVSGLVNVRLLETQ